MSTKYPGGLITKNPVTPAGPYETGAAPGVWTVEQALQYTKQGIWPIAGNTLPYIEDVFSTYLYTGNGSTQTITNGIDLAGKGGLVWTKARVTAGFGNELTDTVRGAGLRLISNTTGAQGGAGSSDTTGFTSSGFQLTFNNGLGNLTGENYVSWTFREQPKFFDIVTWTGDDTYGRAIPHNLGSTPGCFIIKCTSNASTDWIVYHSALGVNSNVYLNDTTSAVSGNNFYNGIAPTSTNIYVGSSTVGSNAYVNQSGRTYVAYLFASNAGGFGLTGTDNVISCGSYTADGTDKTISLGYEPQWVMVKRATNVGDWIMLDTMRSWSYGTESYLKANTSGAEDTGNTDGNPTATGFFIEGAGNLGVKYAGVNQTMIYIAIRRGPMKVPTSGTSVFAPVTYSGDGTNGTRTITTNFPVDSAFSLNRTGATGKASWNRLIGNGQMLITNTSAAQVDQGNTGAAFGSSTGLIVGGRIELNYSGYNYVLEAFQRAPGFFDEVCYAGTGTAQNISHNLGVAPELIITKDRTGVNAWGVGSTALGGWGDDKYLTLNTDRYVNYSGSLNCWNSTAPTSSVFTVGTFPYTNQSGRNYIAYLFATCAGVSKVGSYTGTGATQTISCGFTGGARFVFVKRVDSLGDWYIWDTARGMVSSNDPELYFNLTTAENYNESIYTTTGGFQIVSTAAGINASGGSYIFLAIA